MSLRGFLCLAAGLSALGLTHAAAADDAAPVATAPTSTDQKIAQWLKDAPAGDASDDDRAGGRRRGCPAGPPDRKMHGEVGAAVGSGGYRSAYGVVNMPVGDSGSATVGVATEQGRGLGRGRWGGRSFFFSGAWGPGARGRMRPRQAAADCSEQAEAAGSAPNEQPPEASGGIPPQH